jgi:hypothetical protein
MNKISEFLTGLNQDLHDWVKGRSAMIRLPLLVYLAYCGFNHFKDHEYSSWFGGLTFGLHELGHVIFRPFGEFMAIAGGSFWQLAFPLIGAVMLLYSRDYFGIAVVGCWESFSLYNLATYIGDAQAQVLPLLSIGGGDAFHDWEYLLVKFGMLEQDTKIAGMVRFVGFLVLLASLWLGIWCCYLMAKSKEN